MNLKKKELKVNVPYQKEHPEQKEDEKYIGNCIDKVWDQILWKTKRKGVKPLRQTTGEFINSKKLYPVFIKQQEYVDYIEGKFNLIDNQPKKLLIKKKLKRK